MAALSDGLFAGANGADLRLALQGYFATLGMACHGRPPKTGEKQ